MHPCITDPQQREVRKLSVSPTSPKESQRQDVPFVLEPSLLKFEDLQDPRTRATGGPMPWPARWRLWPPHHLPEWISQVKACFRGSRAIVSAGTAPKRGAPGELSTSPYRPSCTQRTRHNGIATPHWPNPSLPITAAGARKLLLFDEP
jgi:hypothetical protein